MEIYLLGAVLAFISSIAAVMYAIMASKESFYEMDISEATIFILVFSILSWFSLFIILVVGILYPIIKYIVKRQKEKETK